MNIPTVNEGLQTPLLRFPEFFSNWITFKLNELGDSSRGAIKAGPFGSALKKEFYVTSGYKIYGQEQVISSNPYKGAYYINEDKFNSLKSCAVIPGDILVSLVGTIGKVLVIPEDAEAGIINPRLLRISLDSKRVDPKFIKYFLGRPKTVYKLESWSQGGTMGVLNASLFKMLPISLPEMKEQQKIAEFLSTVDKKIALLKEKHALLEQYKKGVMQKLFKQEIRFKDDSGCDFPNWQEKTMVQVLTPEIRELNKPSEKYLALGVRSHMKGTFQKPDSDPDAIAMEKLYIVRPNDLIVNITFAWEGAIAIAKPEDDGGLVSHRFPTYTFKSEQATHRFFKHIIQLKRFKHMLDLISPGGAGRNRVLSKGEFLKLKWILPSVPEQEKIADFLDAIDMKLSLLNKQIELTETFKKGLLQQMFV